MSSPSLTLSPSLTYSQNLQQKEKEENDEKLKLQHTQAVLLSRLAELGASNALQSIPATSASSNHPPKDMYLAQALCQPLDASPDSSPSIMAKGTQTEPCSSLRGSPKVGGQSSPQIKAQEEDENVVIDILTHESEESDESSSTTSGSDGGCTTTSHKYQIAV